jgi:hypothetical protein
VLRCCAADPNGQVSHQRTPALRWAFCFSVSQRIKLVALLEYALEFSFSTADSAHLRPFVGFSTTVDFFSSVRHFSLQTAGKRRQV